MSDWNPALYRQFEEERTRPAAELLARVPQTTVTRALDLGCGPGNSTELLRQRYAAADITGIDNSESMLTQARQRLAGVRFQCRDINEWTPETPPDLIFANATLQWLPDHARLVPRLLAALRAEGVLAVQMPDNRVEPSHALMREVAAEAPFSSLIADAAHIRVRIESPERYYDLLAPAAHIDLWRTTYYHRLADAAAIVQWVSATGLRPFLEPLQAQFLSEYQRRIDAAYPPQADGTRLLRFPRLFMVARRRGDR